MSDTSLLVNLALDAMKNSYSPYSHFKVGAAVMGKSGKIYTGTNIENSSFGATVCAERCAIFKGISEGEKVFEKIAIVCSTGELAPPCGMCLQVMTEFMNAQTGEVILSGKSGTKVYKLKDLIPLGFHLHK